MIENKKKIIDLIYSRTFIFICGFILILSNCYLSEFKGVKECVDIFVCIFCIFSLLVSLITRKISFFSISVLIYCICIAISTYLGQYSDMEIFLKTYYKIIAIVLYLDYGLRHYSKNVISSFYLVFYILTVINFYTIVRYPNGWYAGELFSNNWFFGYDNIHIVMYFPALMFMWLNTKMNNKKMGAKEYILIAIISYCVYFCFSANSVVAFTVFLIYLGFYKYINRSKRLNVKSYTYIFIAIFVGIVLLRLQNLFSWLIVDILGKNLTFTGRTKIWDEVIKYIKLNWITGYGQEDTAIIGSKLGHRAFTHAHNTILDVLYKGGVLSCIPFLGMFIMPIVKLYKNKEDEISKMLSLVMLCFYIMMNFEARQEKLGLYIVLVTCYNVVNIITNAMATNKDDLSEKNKKDIEYMKERHQNGQS